MDRWAASLRGDEVLTSRIRSCPRNTVRSYQVKPALEKGESDDDARKTLLRMVGYSAISAST